MDRHLGLEFGDPPAGGEQLGVLAAGRPGQLTGVDELLAAPDVDRLLADVQISGELGDPTSGRDQIQTLPRNLGGYSSARDW
jgi:hypothetical protein